MKNLLFLFLSICTFGCTISAQELKRLPMPAEIGVPGYVFKIGDNFYLANDLNRVYKTDKDYRILKTYTNDFPVKDYFYNGTLHKIGDNLYINYVHYIKKEKKVQFGYISIENPTDKKIYNTEPFNDQVGLLTRCYKKLLHSPDGKKFYVITLVKPTQTMAYKMLEFNDKFELVQEHKIDIGEAYDEFKKLDFCITSNSLQIIAPAEGDENPLTVYSYSLTGKSISSKTIDQPSGFRSLDPGFVWHYMDLDKKTNTLRFCFDVKDPHWDFWETKSINTSKEIAKVTSYNITTGKLSTVSVKLTPDEVDSLKYAGNLKNDIKYAYKVGSTHTYSMPDGKYAVLVEMVNYVPHTFSGNTTELQSNNNLILRIYDSEGNLVSGRSLYQKRAGTNKTRIGVIGNKLWVFCNTYRRDDIEKEEVDGKRLLGCYVADTDGNIGYSKLRLIDPYPRFVDDEGIILFDNPEANEVLYIDGR